MDSNTNSMDKSGKSLCYLKKATKILLSLFVFSYIFSTSSLVVLVRTYDYLVSNYSIKIFSYTSERNYIFLLCNGILVLIIQTSGLISKIAPVESSSIKAGGRIDDGYRAEKVDDHQPKVVARKLDVVQEIKGIAPAELVDMNENSPEFETLEEREKLEEYEEGKEEEEEEQSTEELNKRCEEFIKKMKQEILRVHEVL